MRSFSSFPMVWTTIFYSILLTLIVLFLGETSGVGSLLTHCFGVQGLSSVCYMASGAKLTPLNGLVHKVEFSALFLKCGEDQ